MNQFKRNQPKICQEIQQSTFIIEEEENNEAELVIIQNKPKKRMSNRDHTLETLETISVVDIDLMSQIEEECSNETELIELR